MTVSPTAAQAVQSANRHGEPVVRREAEADGGDGGHAQRDVRDRLAAVLCEHVLAYSCSRDYPWGFAAVGHDSPSLHRPQKTLVRMRPACCAVVRNPA